MRRRSKLLSFLPTQYGIHLLVCLAVAVNFLNVWASFSYERLDFDAAHFYLPYAEQFLREGLNFLATDKSVYYTPLSYLYPALLGADLLAVKVANIILSCLMVMLLFRSVSLLHSRLAGILAAFLFALSPLIAPWIPTALTEPPYLFLLVVWLWAVSEIVVNQRGRLVPVAGVAFGLAILARGTFIYFLYLLIIIFVIALLIKREQRELYGNLLWAHLVALIFPLLFIIKNWWLFDYPMFATGAGNALYFGSHPLTYGYVPTYFGLVYDDGSVLQGMADRLSIAGDNFLKNVGLTMLAQREGADLLLAYFNKTMAFLFVTKAELSDSIFNIRSLRIAEVILSVVGLFAVRPLLMRWLIGGALLYQIVVHIPVNYEHRYSVGALDLWLIVFSAIGMAYFIHNAITLRQNFPSPSLGEGAPGGNIYVAMYIDSSRRGGSPLKLVAVLILMFAAISYGEWHRINSPPLMPNILAVPHDVIWKREGNDLTALQGVAIVSEGEGRYRLDGDYPAWYLPVHNVKELYYGANYVLSFTLSAQDAGAEKNCRGQVFYKKRDAAEFFEGQSIAYLIPADGQPHSYHFGATLPLGLNSEGDLRLSVYCPKGTVVKLEAVFISIPQVGSVYRQRYLDKIAAGE